MIKELNHSLPKKKKIDSMARQNTNEFKKGFILTFPFLLLMTLIFHCFMICYAVVSSQKTAPK